MLAVLWSVHLRHGEADCESTLSLLSRQVPKILDRRSNLSGVLRFPRQEAQKQVERFERGSSSTEIFRHLCFVLYCHYIGRASI